MVITPLEERKIHEEDSSQDVAPGEKFSSVLENTDDENQDKITRNKTSVMISTGKAKILDARVE